jgi:hypothetical protein
MSGLPAVDEAVVTEARCDSAAVVIGFERYAALPTVPYATRDAAAFASFVQRTLQCPAPTVLGDHATRDDVLAALTAAGKQPGVHTVWVYFAGNAATVTRPVLLLPDAPADASQLEAHGVALADVRSLARAGGAELVLVVDAAFEGRSRSGQDLIVGKRFPPMSPTLVDPGSIEWLAATPGEVAGPLELAEHGAFTWALLGALRGWADQPRPDARVSAAEADRFVLDALDHLGVDQHPELRGDRFRTLSLATEPAPPLDPLRWTPPPPPAPSGPTARGTIAVDVPVELSVLVDGQPAARGAATPVPPGRHLVEIRTPTGTPVTGLYVDVVADRQISLAYRDRQLFPR